MQSKSYKPLAPRLALASISISAAAITMGAMVVVPAEIELGDFERYAWLAASAAPARLAAVDEDCAGEPAAERSGSRFDAHVDAGRFLAKGKR